MTSRVAKNPILLPKGIELIILNQEITVKGAKGQLKFAIHPDVSITHDDNQLKFAARHLTQAANALAGTTRALINNMVYGVVNGFERKLKLVGVGYRAQAKDKVLDLTVGFSHPVNFSVPEGITIETPTQTEIVIRGIDKQLVGQVAAKIRDIRPPEPYKGKGICYSDEKIVLKEAKKK